jgi:DNA-directed RNA polymerase specialized sigma24 family protein
MFKDDMIGDGIENCITYIDNFDPAKSSNPFAYFTQIIYYAFLRRIQKEKKQVDIKNKMIEKSGFSEVFTGDEHGNASAYEQIKNSLEQKMRY